MSIPLAIESPGPQSRKAPRRPRSRIAPFLRAASLRVALVSLCAVVACQIIPGDADPTWSGETVKGIPPSATHVGEFSGAYHDGLPVYLFPKIHVIGHRSAD